MTFAITTFGTHNLLRGEAHPRPFADVIAWQEDNHKAVGTRLPIRYATFRHGAVPGLAISWDTQVWSGVRTDGFESFTSGAVQTTRPRRKVTPRRGWIWIFLRHIETGQVIEFVCTHAVSGAYNAPKPTTRWRRVQWRGHRARLSNWVALQSVHGHQLVLMGDFNRHRFVEYGNLRHCAPSPRGSRVPYDQIYASRRLAMGPARRRPMWGSDHHAWVARAVLQQVDR